MVYLVTDKYKMSGLSNAFRKLGKHLDSKLDEFFMVKWSLGVHKSATSAFH